MNKRILSTVPVFAFVLQVAGVSSAYEEPDYEVGARYDGFEVRSYAPYLVAETEVSGEFDEVGNVAFRRLFGFISGKNSGSAEIAMTAPVVQEPAEGEKIAMTVPVTQTPTESGSYLFRFVMPSEYTLQTLPRPTDPKVRVREVPARRVAARRYSGFWSTSNFQKNEAILRDGLRREGLKAAGPALWARYNSPFSLWFLRRNEVLIELEATR